MRIEIAFCFDEKMLKAACVAVGSLLDNREKTEHFNIHCICNEQAMEQREKIVRVVEARDRQSHILFYPAPKSFDDSYESRGISVSTYFRLSIHRILEKLDKVIYSDVDVLFLNSIAEIWNIELDSYLLAGVKGANNFHDKWESLLQQEYAEEIAGLQGRYVNAGVLLMNLKAIRDWNPDQIWKTMSLKQYDYQDQDILNITCRGRIMYLPLYNNVPAHLTKKDFEFYSKDNVYSENEQKEAWSFPHILHYTGEKPWINRGTNKADIWWSYVDSQPDIRIMFDKMKIKNRKNTGLIGKINRHLPW